MLLLENKILTWKHSQWTCGFHYSANETVQIGHKLSDWIEAVLGVTSTGLRLDVGTLIPSRLQHDPSMSPIEIYGFMLQFLIVVG